MEIWKCICPYPHAVDIILEEINKAMAEGDTGKTFEYLQNKETNLPYLYGDRRDKYIAALKREREEGIPRNVMVGFI